MRTILTLSENSWKLVLNSKGAAGPVEISAMTTKKQSRPSKARRLNKDRCDALSIPNYVIKKEPSHGARRGREFVTQRTTQQGRQGRRITHPYWTGRWTARVVENHKPPSDGTKNFAPATTRLQPEITLKSRHRQSGSRNENSWMLVLNTSGKNGPMDQRDD